MANLAGWVQGAQPEAIAGMLCRAPALSPQIDESIRSMATLLSAPEAAAPLHSHGGSVAQGLCQRRRVHALVPGVL